MSLPYKLITIYTNEGVRWHGKPLSEAVVQQVSRLKIAARCLVCRGIAGCYEGGEIASQKILMLSLDMPLKIEIILPAPELGRLLPDLENMVEEGIVVVQDLKIHAHRTRHRLIPKHLLVRDAMTPAPRTVTATASVYEVIMLLLAAGFHGVPVIDGEERVVGMVTQGDLLARGGLRVRLGWLARLQQEQVDAHLQDLTKRTVETIMSRPVTVIDEDRAVVEAVSVMLKKGLKRLPVVDAGKRLTGMLARVDIFRVVTREAADISRFETYQVVVDDVRYVRDIMRRDTQTVLPDTSLHEIIRLIDANHIQRVAVVDQSGRFLGLIFDHDLLAVCAADTVGMWDYLIRKVPFAEIGRRHRALDQRLRAGTAAALMQRDIVTVREETSIAAAIEVMAARGFKRIPVVDEDGTFKGMISRDAVLRLGSGE